MGRRRVRAQRGPRSVRRGVAAGDMTPRDPGRMLVIDAANVIGSRPAGWWRDRPGAARVFTERVRATVIAGRLHPPVTIVLEGRAPAGRTRPRSTAWWSCMRPARGTTRFAAIAEANRVA